MRRSPQVSNTRANCRAHHRHSLALQLGAQEENTEKERRSIGRRVRRGSYRHVIFLTAIAPDLLSWRIFWFAEAVTPRHPSPRSRQRTTAKLRLSQFVTCLTAVAPGVLASGLMSRTRCSRRADDFEPNFDSALPDCRC